MPYVIITLIIAMLSMTDTAEANRYNHRYSDDSSYTQQYKKSPTKQVKVTKQENKVIPKTTEEVADVYNSDVNDATESCSKKSQDAWALKARRANRANNTQGIDASDIIWDYTMYLNKCTGI